MRPGFCIMLILSFAGTLGGQVLCNSKVVILTEDGKCNNSQYIPVLEDDFNGNELDTTFWKISLGVMRDTGHQTSKHWFDRKNVVVSNGTLRLIVKRDTFPHQCYDSWDEGLWTKHCYDYLFSAGEIQARKRFTHGMYEIRSKVPRGKGIGAAFWMYGNYQNEIDVFEYGNEFDMFGNFDEFKQVSLHNMNCRTDYENDGEMEDCPAHYATGLDLSKDFHVFNLIFTPHKMEWFLDGKSMRTSYLFHDMLGQPVDCNGLTKSNQYLLNREFPRYPMEMYVTTAVGKIGPDEFEDLPQIFEVDYIRYYRQLE
jgi:beta-glucanase (GH16 family)